MGKAGPNLSVVILSYNTKGTTDRCIAKATIASNFYAKKTGQKVAILVVDNNSSDGTQEMIKQKYPQVILLAQKTNTGVGYGYNIGMKAARTPYILIMNSDLLLKKNTLCEAYKYLAGDESCDVLVCNLLDDKGRLEQQGGHFPTPLRTVRWLLGIESVPFIKERILRIYQYNDEFYGAENDIEWAPTCFFFLKRKVYDVTQGNDKNLFLYMEDVEWSKRIREKGFNIRFTPKFSATHIGGVSSSRKLPPQYILKRQVEGIKYYQKKHHPKTYPLVVPVLFAGFGARSLFYLLKGDLGKSGAYLQSVFTRPAN